MARYLRSQDRELLLVVDPFEELLADGKLPDQDLISVLLPPPEAAEEAARVILTLRSDFLPALLSTPGVQLNGRMYVVPPLNEEQLRQAVEGPAEARRVTFENGLADKIVRDAAGGALPLLEFTLTRLWETQRHRELTFEGYNAMGEVAGALEQVAEEQMKQFTGTAPDRLDHVLLRLVRVTPGGPGLATRQRVFQDDISPEEWQVLLRLGDARLAIIDADPASNDRQYAELAHESLITAWRRLHDLVTENKDFLTWLARIQQRAADADPLPEARIAEARQWLETRSAEIPAPVRAFVESSQTAAEAKLRRAEALRLAADAELALHGKPPSAIVALALGTESVLTEPTLQGDLALRHVLGLHPRASVRLDHHGAVNGLAFSPDGTRIAVAGDTPGIPVFDPATGSELARLDHGTVNAVVFSPDGTRIATCGNDAARVFDLDTYAELGRLHHEGPVTAAVFSWDGTRVATGSDDFSSRVFDAATGAQLARLDHDAAVNAVAFSPDGTRVATGSDDCSARVFDAATGAQLARLGPRRSGEGGGVQPGRDAGRDG